MPANAAKQAASGLLHAGSRAHGHSHGGHGHSHGLGNKRRTSADLARIRRNTMGIPMGLPAPKPDEVATGAKYTATWIISGFVMSLLKYVFCVVAAVMIHGHDKGRCIGQPLYHDRAECEGHGGEWKAGLNDFLSLGIGIQLVSTFVTCLITSKYSKIGVNISGPDIIAAIFAAAMAKPV